MSLAFVGHHLRLLLTLKWYRHPSFGRVTLAGFAMGIALMAKNHRHPRGVRDDGSAHKRRPPRQDGPTTPSWPVPCVFGDRRVCRLVVGGVMQLHLWRAFRSNRPARES